MRRGPRILAAVAVTAIVTVAITWDLGLQHWLAYNTGSENVPGVAHNYNFPSGIGSIIIPPVLNGLALLAVLWWHNQCHVDGCYWYARRKTAAGDLACWRHHPDRKLTVADIRQRHHLYLGGKPGRG